MQFTIKSFLTVVILIFMSSDTCFGQPNEDSLLTVAYQTESDSIKYRQYFKLVSGFKFHDLDKTKQYTDSIAEIYLRTKDPKYKGISDYYYGFYHRKIDEYDKAIEYYQSAKEFGSKGYLSLYAVSIAEIAGIYLDKGFLAKALEINIEASNFNKTAKDENGIDRLNENYNSIGLIYEQMKESDNALKYYRMAVDIAISDADRSIPYGNMAETFLRLGQADSLVFYAEKCYEIEKEIGDARGIAYAENLRADAYYLSGEYLLAEQASAAAVELYKKYPEKVNMTNAYLILAKSEAKNNKLNSAIKNAKEGLRLAESIHNLNLISHGQTILSEIYESKGEHEMALGLYRSLQSNKDSLNVIKNNDLLQDLSVKYETAQKNEKIADQKVQLSKKDAERNKLFGGIIFLSLLSAMLLYRFKSKQKISNQKIEILKQEKKLLAIDYMVQGQEEERKRIAQDLHDGLGGILSTAKIQLKNIQSEIEKLENLSLVNSAEELIDSAYKEVRRISHDMMPGALVNLGLFAAIEDLAEQVSVNDDLIVKTQWYTTDDNLSQKAQPIIYRIVQETITNTVKYAKASKMLIQMTESQEGYNLTIEDDGIGFDLNDLANEGLGIKSIKSRVDYLNGDLEIITRPNEGTSYEIVIPFK